MSDMHDPHDLHDTPPTSDPGAPDRARRLLGGRRSRGVLWVALVAAITGTGLASVVAVPFAVRLTADVLLGVVALALGAALALGSEE